MKIGLVKFLNARPLDYGLRQEAKENTSLELVEDIPSRLAQKLLDRELNAALISSVEYIRHQDTLRMVPDMGVCTHKQADSLLYIRHKRSKHKPAAWEEVPTIYADHGSRSTIALLRLLYRRHNKKEAKIVEAPPKDILQKLPLDCGGLLIGDAALHFRQSRKAEKYWIFDLASWWYEEEKLPFVFAVWAYHTEKEIDTKIFQKSLSKGIEHIGEIAKEARDFPDAHSYLTKVLHYRFSHEDKKALEKFERECKKYKIL